MEVFGGHIMRKTYGYARVSTKEQHLDRQVRALLENGVEERGSIMDEIQMKWK